MSGRRLGLSGLGMLHADVLAGDTFLSKRLTIDDIGYGTCHPSFYRVPMAAI